MLRRLPPTRNRCTRFKESRRPAIQITAPGVEQMEVSIRGRVQMTEEGNSMRGKALAAVHIGKLPDRPPDRVWGGHGNGTATCQLCGKPLNTEEITYELEYDEEPGDARPTCYSVHLQCFSAWDARRAQPNGGCTNQHQANGNSNRACLPDAGHPGTMPGNEGDTHRGAGAFEHKDSG